MLCAGRGSEHCSGHCPWNNNHVAMAPTAWAPQGRDNPICLPRKELRKCSWGSSPGVCPQQWAQLGRVPSSCREPPCQQRYKGQAMPPALFGGSCWVSEWDDAAAWRNYIERRKGDLLEAFWRAGCGSMPPSTESRYEKQWGDLCVSLPWGFATWSLPWCNVPCCLPALRAPNQY